MQTVVFDKEKDGTQVVVRAWSVRMTVIDAKTYKIRREIDFKDHETALFFADKLTSNN